MSICKLFGKLLSFSMFLTTQSYLMMCLAWEFFRAEWTIVMKTMSVVSQTLLLMMNLKLVMLTRVKVSFLNLDIQYKIVTFSQKLFLTSIPAAFMGERGQFYNRPC